MPLMFPTDLKYHIKAHLMLYLEQRELSLEDRFLGLMSIATALEDTVTKVIKNKEKNNEINVYKFVFKGYAKSPTIREEDKEQVIDMALDVDGLVAELAELVEQGHKINASFDLERKAYQAHLSACVGVNAGYVLGMYGRDLMRALASVVFAHKHVYKAGKWLRKEDVGVDIL